MCPIVRVPATALAVIVFGLGCGGEEAPPPAQTPAAQPATPAPAPAAQPGAMLDPNDATMEQLLTVPHLDEALAQAVVDARPYADMLVVNQVLSALSEEQRDEVYGRLWKRLDLNNASGEEVLLIPGIGERMEHEFEEYRPYRAIEEFRREMGKYVDEAEVARLEHYVELR